MSCLSTNRSGTFIFSYNQFGLYHFPKKKIQTLNQGRQYNWRTFTTISSSRTKGFLWLYCHAAIIDWSRNKRTAHIIYHEKAYPYHLPTFPLITTMLHKHLRLSFDIKTCHNWHWWTQNHFCLAKLLCWFIRTWIPIIFLRKKCCDANVVWWKQLKKT